MTKDNSDLLWNDFLDLCVKYKKIMGPAEFTSHMFVFTTKLAFDCAHTPEEAKIVIQDSINVGIKWSTEEKDHERNN